MSQQAKVFTAVVNGVQTQVKAFHKENALVRFNALSDSVISDCQEIDADNSHQVPVEIL